MFRIVASMGLMFAALAWSVLAMVVIFLIVPSLWEEVLGPYGAPFGALLALAGVIWGSAKMMKLADRLLSDGDSRPRTELAPAPADVPRDWHDYNADIARSKRWAFYRRTRQFDRLADLEAQSKEA